MNLKSFTSLSYNTKKTVLGLVTAAMVAPAIFIGMSVDQGAPMTASFEGSVLSNYVDAVGVETWCIGETEIGRLERGYTKEYCNALFYSRYKEYSKKVYDCYDAKAKRYVTPAIHAAITDVVYNTGAGCGSGMIRHLKAGRPVDACNVILEYKRAGGRDCSIRTSGCYGIWDRRLKTHPGCLRDAQRLPKEGLQ